MQKLASKMFLKEKDMSGNIRISGITVFWTGYGFLVIYLYSMEADPASGPDPFSIDKQIN
jgi:hypothetical protein